MSTPFPLDDARYRVRSDGHVTAGFSRDVVARDLALVLAWEDDAVARLLDGVLTDLRRDLTDAEATQLVGLVERTGLRVWRELESGTPELGFGLDTPLVPPSEPGAARPITARASFPPPIESDIEHGSGRTRHDWLGNDAYALPLDPLEPHDAPPIVARGSFPPPERSPSDPSLARPDAHTSARAAAAALSRTRPAPIATTPPQVAEATLVAEPASHFSLEGRIGRVRYLARSMLLATILLIAPLFVLPLAPSLAAVLFFVALLVALGVSISATVTRLHDIGLSGALVLVPIVLSCVPPLLGAGQGSPIVLVLSTINLAFWLVLLLVPGQRAASRFGPALRPDDASYRIAVVFLALALIVESLAAYRFITRALPDLVQQLERAAVPGR